MVPSQEFREQGAASFQKGLSPLGIFHSQDKPVCQLFQVVQSLVPNLPSEVSEETTVLFIFLPSPAPLPDFLWFGDLN